MKTFLTTRDRTNRRAELERLECRQLLAGHTGILDSSFGQNGVVNFNDDNETGLLAVQKDGQILVANTVLGEVIGLNSDGTLNKTYGEEGVADASGTIVAIALQSDGKLVLVGTKSTPLVQDSNKFSTALMVERLTASGQPDPTFGKDGVFSMPGDANSAGAAVALRTDKIVASGSTDDGADALILRLNLNGQLDKTFSTNGIVIMKDHQLADAIYILKDGAVMTMLDKNDFEDRIAKLNRLGHFDKTYSADGIRLCLKTPNLCKLS